MTTAVKFVKGSPDLIEGLAIPFGGPIGGRDLDGEYFTKNTDLCLDWFAERPLLYHHGLNDAVKATVIGRVKSYDIRDDGVWAQAELDKNSRYREVVSKLVDDAALGFSSGTVVHLVDTDTSTGEIKRWPWVEESLTPTPANPAALQVYAVKSTDLVDHLVAIEKPIPSAIVAAAMKSLDRPDDDALPDGAKFAEHIDRLLVDASARVRARKDWHAKSGRVLSSATRERLAAHPEQLRALAADIEDLLATADGDSQKAALAVLAEFELQEARLNGVAVGKSAAMDVSDATYALSTVLRLVEKESQTGEPEATETSGNLGRLQQVRDLLTEYIASAAKEVGSPADLAEIAAEEAARAAIAYAY